MSWRIFSLSFAPADGGFRLTAPNGSRPVSTWALPTRSAVTISRFLRELAPRGSSIAVRIVTKNFREFGARGAQSPVLPAAANTTAATSIRGFAYDS
jgi:hypothetical protein